MDERLLDELDADEEVKKSGRSAVLRRIVGQYIDHRRRKAIAEQYRQAYGEADKRLREDFGRWENEGVWPSE